MTNTTDTPTVVLVHGGFADASYWVPVIRQLQASHLPVLAVANPLRGLAHDAEYVASVVRQIDGPVLLVGHSYGGAVISVAVSGICDSKGALLIHASSQSWDHSARVQGDDPPAAVDRRHQSSGRPAREPSCSGCPAPFWSTPARPAGAGIGGWWAVEAVEVDPDAAVEESPGGGGQVSTPGHGRRPPTGSCRTASPWEDRAPSR
jgi:pimeloyl-ACP methyl ester carboxylesterase